MNDGNSIDTSHVNLAIVNPDEANFPLELIIQYNPNSELVSYNWTGALEVLTHLLLHPHDRNQLRTEARRRSPLHSKTLFVQHPRLTCILPLGSHDSDYLLVRTIKSQIITLQRNQGNYNPSMATVIQPPHLPFLLDPYNLLPHPHETSSNVGRFIPFPCEILILPEGPQITPL